MNLWKRDLASHNPYSGELNFHTKHIDKHTLSKNMMTIGVTSATNLTPGTYLDPSNTEIVFRLLSSPSAAQPC
jgi:hypothetical protein